MAIMNFPFSTLEQFMTAFTLCLETEGYSEVYPALFEFLNNVDDGTYEIIDIIKPLYDETDPHQFSKLMTMFLLHPRYVYEYPYFISDIVSFYKSKNPNLEYDVYELLAREFDADIDSEKMPTYEDETKNYYVRGMIIDALIANNVVPIEKFMEFQGKPINWSKFQDVDFDEDVEENGDMTDYSDDMRFAHLRVHSLVLYKIKN
jgi:hypothetical protein